MDWIVVDQKNLCSLDLKIAKNLLYFKPNKNKNSCSLS